MENFNLQIRQIEQNPLVPKESEMEKKLEERTISLEMKNFYEKYLKECLEAEKVNSKAETEVKKITLETLKELKEKGITTEKFLDYLCQNQGVLLHSSTEEISDNNKLRSFSRKKIFATDKAAIAIMKSLYSNIGVNLEYPYFINENSPLKLKIHTPPDGKFTESKKGFIYIFGDKEEFKNTPRGSWQYIKEAEEVKFKAIIETEEEDFKYPVEICKDLDSYR